jgi:hypothetical protein
MKTAGDYRAEAARLRDLEKDATDPEVLKALRDMIEELEAEARARENGA